VNTIGEPISRVDGRLKVTGRAAYTADIPLADAAHAAMVHSTIANGRTVSIDTRTAEKAPGVLAVFTHRNMPRMHPTPKPWSHLHPHGQGYLPLQDDKIHYAGQPIALVVATTRDQAMHAATLVAVQYQAKRAVFFSRETAREAVDPPQFLWPVASAMPRRAFARASLGSRTPTRHRIATIIRWSRTRRWRPGMRAAG
jgi:xanthine dehydrogenase YagR molybdenum-binding subunit